MNRLNSGAFTIIELLFVVVVLSVIAAAALFRPGFDFTVKSKARTAAQRIVSDLRLARRLAISNNEDYTLTVIPANNQYAIYDSSSAQVGATRVLDSSISLSGDTDFVFTSLGNATSGNSLSVAMNSFQYDISVISSTGMISMEEN